MANKLNSPAADDLFEAILTLETVDECYAFFEDLLTVNEFQAATQRFAVARMLRKGETYLDIASGTGASTATISRVNRALNYGADGYDTVISRLQAREEA